MTVFAGIVALDRRNPVPTERTHALAGALSRHVGDRPRVRRGDGFFFAQLLLPAETQVCEHSDESGSVTMLAGRPLFGVGNGPEVEVLHAALRRADHSMLRTARGNYCAMHWDAPFHRLLLIADRLAVRPVYYGIEDGFLYFSTALRVLEAVRPLVQRMDVRGISEIASFGYPLANRSPYESIRTMQPGMLLEAPCNGDTRAETYWRWDQLAPTSVPDDELPREMHKVFMQAIERRLGNERSVVAGLSGGLDSRCVVAGLRGLGAEVHTINFAPSGSEDLALGKMAAQALGSRHFEFPTGPLDFWDRMHASHKAWYEATPPEERPTRPHELWSGDGGSCGMGHIYLNEQIVELMRQGSTEDAIDCYLKLNGIGLPGKLLSRRERQRMVAYPRTGVAEELRRLEAIDVGRRMHVYLMVNGQRRMHTNHYENIDLRRIELVTPFFDAELVKLVLSSPIDAFLRHRFYSVWLKEFQPSVLAVPWQAYPGHDPCPLPTPPGLRNQWDDWYDKQTSAELSKRDVKLADELLRDPRLPDGLFNRHVLWLARRLTGMGLGDYGHVIRCAAVFTRYSRPD
jgi:asparagine synthase (glutamine-hydrolysing)